MSDTELLAQPYPALLLYPPLSFSLCDMPKRVKIQKYKQREKLYENAAQTRHESASVGLSQMFALYSAGSATAATTTMVG